MKADTHRLFVDSTAANDSPLRNHVFVIMSKLVISAKLIKIGIMTFSNSCSCYAKIVMGLFPRCLIPLKVADKAITYHAAPSTSI